MINFSCIKRSKVCHAYRINHLKELDENWHVDHKSAFLWFEMNWKKDHGEPNRCQNYTIELVNKNPPSYIATVQSSELKITLYLK